VLLHHICGLSMHARPPFQAPCAPALNAPALGLQAHAQLFSHSQVSQSALLLDSWAAAPAYSSALAKACKWQGEH